MTKKLSIVTVNINDKIGLRKTIESVINQTFNDYEYIIIDGASTDGSQEVIKEFNDRITCSISEPDDGIYNAMNKGILKAQGEYVQFLNSGDWLADSYVLSKIFVQNDGSLDIIYGDLVQSFPDGRNDIIKMPESITASFLYNSNLFQPVTFIKRDLFIKYGLYDESYKIIANHAFFVKVFLTGSMRSKYQEIVVANIVMDGICSKVGNFLQLNEERSRAFKEQLSPEYLRLIVDYNRLSNIHLRLGINKIIFVIKKVNRIIHDVKLSLNNFIRNYFVYKMINPFKINHYDIPIIINNRNRVTYLSRLINSLENRGYRNINIIDNNSDYPPLLDYYKNTKYKIYSLNYNGGFCALWDSGIFDRYFKNIFYVYTDSDMELAEDCPDNFLSFMLFNLWRHKKVDKIGLSININDLPDNYNKKSDVINHESQYWENEFDKNLFDAYVDTTFALYRQNKFGPTGYIKALRLKPPYSIKHLPWYENSDQQNKENIYYMTHCETRSQWSKLKIQQDKFLK